MGRRGRVVAGLVALAVVIAVVVGAVVLSGGDDAAPVGAVAAVQDDHLPVDPIDTIPDRLDLIAATGVTTTRVNLFWSDIAPSEPAAPADPADPAYDFSPRRPDHARAWPSARSRPSSRCTTHRRLGHGAARAPRGRGQPQRPRPEDFARLHGGAGARYSGGFTAPGGEKLPEVRHFEIWNEPNLAALLRPAVRGHRPGVARHLRGHGQGRLPGDQEGQRRRGGDRRRRRPPQQHEPHRHRRHRLAQGLQQRDIPLDAYSQHVYPARGAARRHHGHPSWATIGRLLDELDAWKPGLPLYITEAGYTTAATPYRDTTR